MLAIIAVGVAFRLQSLPNLSGSHLLDTDSLRLYRQVLLILDRGSLPSVDMERWLPAGRDLTTYLSLSSYALAYACRAVRAVRVVLGRGAAGQGDHDTGRTGGHQADTLHGETVLIGIGGTFAPVWRSVP